MNARFACSFVMLHPARVNPKGVSFSWFVLSVPSYKSRSYWETKRPFSLTAVALPKHLRRRIPSQPDLRYFIEVIALQLHAASRQLISHVGAVISDHSEFTSVKIMPKSLNSPNCSEALLFCCTVIPQGLIEFPAGAGGCGFPFRLGFGKVRLPTRTVRYR